MSVIKHELGLVDYDEFIGVITDDDRLVARIYFDTDDICAKEAHEVAEHIVKTWNESL